MSVSLRLHRGFAAQPPLRFRRAQRGGAAVEFAIIGPVLLLLLFGMITYGGYFMTAHTVQQVANDAARAAIAGLDDAERLSLAREAATDAIARQPDMQGELAAISVLRSGPTVAVTLTYDASEDAFWAFESLVPSPDRRIERTATIRVGGL